MPRAHKGNDGWKTDEWAELAKKVSEDDKNMEQKEQGDITYEPQQVEEVRRELHAYMDHTFAEKKGSLSGISAMLRVATSWMSSPRPWKEP